MGDEEGERPLKLVVNNVRKFRIKTPLEKLREKYESTLREREEEHEKELDALHQKHVQKVKGIRRDYRIGLVAMSVVAAAALYFSKNSWNSEEVDRQPEGIILLHKDLNGDRRDDAYIILENGHKVPMYGIITSFGMQYVSSEKMREWGYWNVNYQNIEDKLNEPYRFEQSNSGQSSKKIFKITH